MTRRFDLFLHLRLNKRLSKQWWGWWFETPWGPLWRHFNGDENIVIMPVPRQAIIWANVGLLLIGPLGILVKFESTYLNLQARKLTSKCCLSTKLRPFFLGLTWWSHETEIFSALLAICEGNWPVIGEFPSQRPMTRSFDVFFDLCLNTRLSKQMGPRWFETPSCSLWRHCNEYDNGITGYIIRRISNFSVFKSVLFHLCGMS